MCGGLLSGGRVLAPFDILRREWPLLKTEVVPFNLSVSVIETFTLSLPRVEPIFNQDIGCYAPTARGKAMPRALKDFREAEFFHSSSRSPQWDMSDRALLSALTIGAILAIAIFAFVALSFFSH